MVIYGERDLIAPPEFAEIIYVKIEAPASQRTLMILLNSGHSSEGPEIAILQSVIRRFMDGTIR
jgi:esterase/lipase